jgi:hypothetical protein
MTNREQQLQQQAARYHQVEQLLDALAQQLHQQPVAEVSAAALGLNEFGNALRSFREGACTSHLLQRCIEQPHEAGTLPLLQLICVSRAARLQVTYKTHGTHPGVALSTTVKLQPHEKLEHHFILA